MRHIWKAILVVLCMGTLALAGFALPRHVLRMDQMDKVKELAKKKKAPITFVFTDKDSH